jgi:O-antigen ligase
MGILISLFAFLIIAVLGLQYANTRGMYRVSSPYETMGLLRVSSRQRFVLLLLGAAVVQAGAFSSALLLVWIVFMLVVLSKYGARFSESTLFLVYFFYLIWLLFSLIRTPEPVFGLRMFAKYLFPFLVALVTSSIPINDTFFLKTLKVAFTSLILVSITIPLPYLFPIGFITGPLLGPVIWWGPAIIDSSPFTMALAIVLYKLTKKKIYLYAIGFLFLVPAITAVRTGLIGLAVTLLAISFFKYKLRALPIFISVIVVAIATVLYVPDIRDKMFGGTFTSADEVINSLNVLSIDNVDTSGRQALWEWALNSFYKNNELTGSGIGQVQAQLYTGNTPFPELNALHNDYIVILCDAGQIGLFLYLAMKFVFVLLSFRIYNNKKNDESARNSAFIAGTSLCGIMACALTDNVINYSLITLTYPYAFFGFALALKRINNKKSHAVLDRNTIE